MDLKTRFQRSQMASTSNFQTQNIPPDLLQPLASALLAYPSPRLLHYKEPNTWLASTILYTGIGGLPTVTFMGATTNTRCHGR